MEMESIRLNKYLGQVGVCSRREADELIAKGAVTIDGVPAQTGQKVVGTERICIHGKPIKSRDGGHIYMVLNKPRGIVCTTKNDKANVIDFLGLSQRVFPVGRLDKDSEGLLLLTSDGSIVNAMMKSINGHEKEYVVTINCPVTREFLDQMAAGVYLEELEVRTKPCRVKKLGPYTFSIILTQGLNRQIRRMCQALSCRVVTLKRVRIMNLKLNDLPAGQWRLLREEELKQLKSQLL